ncbi:hypothetical protein G9A89_019837 [Geosiphon pyriformis]|nr:hypothetical protein G9A89_019837 [Geosiphon pyriformis]
MADKKIKKIITNSSHSNNTQQPERTLSRGKSVVGPRPLPSTTTPPNNSVSNNNNPEINSNGYNHSNNITTLSPQKTKTTPGLPFVTLLTHDDPAQSRSPTTASAPFPALVSPKPHKPLATAHNDISRALETQETDIDMRSGRESWFPGDERNMSVLGHPQIQPNPHQTSNNYQNNNQNEILSYPQQQPPKISGGPLSPPSPPQQYYDQQQQIVYSNQPKSGDLSSIDENGSNENQPPNFISNFPTRYKTTAPVIQQEYPYSPPSSFELATRNLSEGHQAPLPGAYPHVGPNSSPQYHQPGRLSEELARKLPTKAPESQRGHSSAPTSPTKSTPPTLNIQQAPYNQNGPTLAHSQSWSNSTPIQQSGHHYPTLSLITDPQMLNGHHFGQGPVMRQNGAYASQHDQHLWISDQNGSSYEQQNYQNGLRSSVVSVPQRAPSPSYFPRNPSPLGIARQPSPSNPQIGPDGTPLVTLSGGRQSVYGRTSPNPDYRMSVQSAPRSPNTRALRLLIDDKNAKRMTFTSFTLATDENALQRYREAATKAADPTVQVDYAKFLIGMSNFYVTENPTSPNPDSNKNDTYTKLVNESVYWIDKLAKNNHPEAMYIKGTWHEYGNFTKEVNMEKALKYYQSASKQDHAKANTKVGEHYERQRNFGRTISFFQKAASLGDVTALYRLALIYMLGEMKQEVNYKQALIYLKQAANKANEDCPEGAFVYGMILAKEYEQAHVPDELVVPDQHEAKELIQKAANLGYVSALYKMGHCHEYGVLECPFDPVLSVSYYKRAADKGQADAHMALSKWYLCGAEGFFDQNEALAYDHAEKAAKQGLPAAEFAMGYFHEVGINTQVNLQIAKVWYTKAAAHGNQDAKERLERGDTITRLEHENTVQKELKKQRKPDKDKDCIIQ